MPGPCPGPGRAGRPTCPAPCAGAVGPPSEGPGGGPRRGPLRQGPAHGSLILLIRPWVIHILFVTSPKNMDLGAILDADLDAQRDFAPQCIIQKQD